MPMACALVLLSARRSRMCRNLNEITAMLAFLPSLVCWAFISPHPIAFRAFLQFHLISDFWFVVFLFLATSALHFIFVIHPRHAGACEYLLWAPKNARQLSLPPIQFKPNVRHTLGPQTAGGDCSGGCGASGALSAVWLVK